MKPPSPRIAAALVSPLLAVTAPLCAAQGVHVVALDCEERTPLPYDRSIAQRIEGPALGLGTGPDLNDADQIAFSDRTGIYRYDLSETGGPGALRLIASLYDPVVACTNMDPEQRLDDFSQVVRINEQSEVTWLSRACALELPEQFPDCDTPIDGNGGLGNCPMGQQPAVMVARLGGLGVGVGYGLTQLSYGTYQIRENDFEMLERGAVAAVTKQQDVCTHTPGASAVRLFNPPPTPNASEELVALDDPAPEAIGRWCGDSDFDAFLRLSPGEDKPHVILGQACTDTEARDIAADMLDGDLLLACARPMGPGSGPAGPGSNPQVYLPTAQENMAKPDLGSVVYALGNDDAVVAWARRSTTGTSLPDCIEQAPDVLVETYVGTGLGLANTPVVELMEVGVHYPSLPGVVTHVHSSPTAARGRAVFAGAYDDGAMTHEAIFLVSGADVVQTVLRAGDALPFPFTSRTFVNFGPPTINRNGIIAFHARHAASDGGDMRGGIFYLRL